MKMKKLLNSVSGVALPLAFGIIIFILWQTQVLHSMLGTDTT